MPKPEKSGLDLLIVTPEMLQGLDTLAGMSKAAGDSHTGDFIIQVKTALVKYPAFAKHAREMAGLQRIAAKALNDSADFIEQLLPEHKQATT